MSQDQCGTILGVGLAALTGYLACNYYDNMKNTKAVEHFKQLPKKKSPAIRRRNKDNFSATKARKIKKVEFLTNTTRFGASTRDVLNYRDIRPMPYIAPAAEGSIPFGGSGLSSNDQNRYGKNIFAVGSGSGNVNVKGMDNSTYNYFPDLASSNI